jgi:hypothetical protein
MADIFDLIYAYDGVLSTGHLSPPEALAVVREYQKGKGKGAVVMGHPDLNNCQATVEAQAELHAWEDMLKNGTVAASRLGQHTRRRICCRNAAYRTGALHHHHRRRRTRSRVLTRNTRPFHCLVLDKKLMTKKNCVLFYAMFQNAC